eukprot:scaffold330_cov144-Skeletonema_menzelii.AAC.6
MMPRCNGWTVDVDLLPPDVSRVTGLESRTSFSWDSAQKDRAKIKKSKTEKVGPITSDTNRNSDG